MTLPPKPITHLLILDFEATCDESNFPRRQQEIIEVPTLLYDVSARKVVDTFREYVKPTIRPTLTPFCTELTGITQEIVDAASPFPEVFVRLTEFLKSHGVYNDMDAFAFLTCGDWDLLTMLPLQIGHVSAPTLASASNQKLPRQQPFDKWINIKKEYGKFYGRKGDAGMAKMLKQLKLPLEGRHHSGLDDCKNIARIVGRMLEDGWKVPERKVLN